MSQDIKNLLLPGTLLSTGAIVMDKEVKKTYINLICTEINMYFILL